MAAQRAIDVPTNSSVSTEVRRGFYFFMSVVLLPVMFLGFAPSDPTWPSSYAVTWFELCATCLTTGSGP